MYMTKHSPNIRTPDTYGSDKDFFVLTAYECTLYLR